MCSPIALAKRMHGVYLRHVVRGSLAESSCVSSPQKVFLRESIQHFLEFRKDVLWLGEERIALGHVALGHVDAAEFSRPCVHILEQILVYTLQVIQVKAECQGIFV